MNEDIKAEFNTTNPEGTNALLVEMVRLLRKIAGEYPK